MKNLTLILVILLTAGLSSNRAQNTWMKKSDFGGTAREGAAGFSIREFGYLGTGLVSGVSVNDFWQYDPEADTWTQKADFGGAARNYAVGFNIGNNGYLGTGTANGGHFKDFWAYDPATNTWTQKANFGGAARSATVGFSIGGRGYIGTGFAGSPEYTPTKDLWEYNPDSDTWTQKADFGGVARFGAAGFSIGGTGYLGAGGAGTDFWAYDPVADSWTQKADFSGGARSLCVAFSIDSKGYLGAGWDISYNFKKDFWEYDPDVDTWTKKADVGDDTRKGAVSFSIGSKGYAGTGQSGSDYAATKDFWAYTAEATTTCVAPSGEATGKITGTSAKLKWDVVAGAEGYKIRYQVANTSEWKTGTTDHNAKPISELLPNTKYIWQVKTFCQMNPNVLSAWSVKQTFTTGSARISDDVAATLGIFPNPVSEKFTLDLQLGTTTDQSANIFLLNSLGKIVYSSHDITSNGELEKEITMPSAASSGWYVVRVLMNDQVIEKKLLYQK